MALLLQHMHFLSHLLLTLSKKSPGMYEPGLFFYIYSVNRTVNLFKY